MISFQKRELNNNLSLPVHNPGQIVIIMEEKKRDYRINKMLIFNLARFGVLLLAVLIFFGSNIAPDSLGHRNAKLFLTVVICYIFSLASHSFLIKQDGASEYLFVSNAFWDIFCVLLVAFFFNIHHNITLISLIALVSSLMSSITFSVRQSLFFGLIMMLLWIITAALIKVLPLVTWPLLQPLSSWQRIEKIFSAFAVHRDLLLEPTLFAISLAAVSILIGYFAAQERDNKIQAELDQEYISQLRRLNDAIIEEMLNGIMVLNDEGIIMTLNRKAREIFGLKQDDIIPYKIEDLSREINNFVFKWRDWPVDNNFQLETGLYKYNVSFSQLKEPNTNLTLTLVLLEDVLQTQRRAQENRLSIMGRLSSSIAHEIKNPLTIVRASVDLLSAELEERGEKNLDNLMEKVLRNCNRISTIVDSILNLFSGNPCTQKLIPLNTFLLSVISEARLNDELGKGKAIISYSLAATENYSIFFDNAYLRQILFNLMLNAVKHSGKEEVNILIRTAINIKHFLYIDVIDNGSGVPEENEEKIFDPFFSSCQSTGLGLYLVREMCAANEAQISYVPGQGGACFRLAMERYKYKVGE